MSFKVGDKVVVTDVNMKGPFSGTIAGIGRKYIALKGDFNKYDKKTGVQVGQWTHRRIYTMEQWGEWHRAELAVKELEAFGVICVRGTPPERVLLIHSTLRPLLAVRTAVEKA